MLGCRWQVCAAAAAALRQPPTPNPSFTSVNPNPPTPTPHQLLAAADLGEHSQPGIGHCHHAHVRLNGAEGKVGGGRLPVFDDRIEEGGLGLGLGVGGWGRGERRDIC